MFAFAASWELYDDFSSETLDAEKWNNSSTVSTIIVENQRVKIIHQMGNPNVSGYLNLIQNSENILGIKAAITIDSCTGDVRTRMVGYPAIMNGYDIFTAIQLQPGAERIYSYIELEGPPPDYALIAQLHYGQFKRPVNIIGDTYNVSMIFSNNGMSYEVDGLGKIDYKYATSVTPSINYWRAIGTKSSNGDGPCTVYIDDVYVLRP
jgi:hypothetical protein